MRVANGARGIAFSGPDPGAAARGLGALFPAHTPPAATFEAGAGGSAWRVFLSQVEPGPAGAPAGLEFLSIEQLQAGPEALEPALAGILDALEPHLIGIPYLHLGENDFIYKFRPEKERNVSIYAQDAAAERSCWRARVLIAAQSSDW